MRSALISIAQYTRVNLPGLTLLAEDRHEGNKLLEIDGGAKLRAAVEDPTLERVHHYLRNAYKLLRGQLSVSIKIIEIESCTL